MNATRVYQLKQQIDEALRQYGASAIAWETQWCVIRIVKYDYPYSSDRSILYQEFIASEQDWQQKRASIEAALAAIVAKEEKPQMDIDTAHACAAKIVSTMLQRSIKAGTIDMLIAENWTGEDAQAVKREVSAIAEHLGYEAEKPEGEHTTEA